MAGKTKGLSFYNLVSYTKQRYGDDGLAQLRRACDPEQRRILAEALPVSWYSLDTYAEVLETLANLHPELPNLPEDFGRFSSEVDLTTVHKLLMRVADPGFIFQQTMKLWRRFHDTGEWTIDRHEHGATGVLRDWGCVNRYLCRELVGYIDKTLSLGMGKNIHVEHPSCRARGDEECVFQVRWR